MVARFTENTQQLNRSSDAALQAGDFGRGAQAIARGAADLGQSLKQAASDLDDIHAIRDEAIVRKMDAEDAVEISKLRAQALTASGFDAEPATQTAIQAIEERRKTRMTQLKNPRQRALYEQVFSRRQAASLEDFTTHNIRETKKANIEASGARIDAYTSVAVDEHANPVAFKDAVDTAVGEVKVRYQGAGADVIARQEKIVRSNIHKGVINKLLTNPDTILDAEEWRQKHTNEILSEDETALQKAINPVLEEEEDNADLGRILSGATGGDEPVEQGDPADADPAATLPQNNGETESYYSERLTKTPPATQLKSAKREVVSADPNQAVLRGKGRITNTAGQHRARGSSNAVDIAAPAGTPIYPPMSGKVVKNWWSPEGGWSVLIQHPNGKVTGYAHMRAQSGLDVGQEVESSTVIGGVGNTGSKSHGNHLHYTVRNSATGPKIDPQSADWTDAKAVAHDKADWKEGDLPRYEAEKPQLAKALSDLHTLATRENWSPRKYERMASKVRSHFAVNDQLYRQAQDEVMDSAAAAIAAADLDGKPLTSRSQVPGYGQLDTQGRARVDAMLAANRKAAEGGEEGGVKANGPTFLDLFEASATDQEAFKGVDLRLVPDITRSERARLIGIQSKLLGKDGDPSNFASNHTRIYSAIGRFSPEQRGYKTVKPKDEDRRKHAILFQAVNARVNEEQQRLKRQLSDDEIDALVRQQVVAVTRYNGSDKTELPRYIAERTKRGAGERDTVQIPAADYNRIVATWQRTHNGATPSQREITAIYLRSLGR